MAVLDSVARSTEPWSVEEDVKLTAPSPPPSKLSKGDVLWSKFCDRASVKKGVTWEPPPHPDPCEEYGLVFLCHAHLYVFSNRYECDILRDLCRVIYNRPNLLTASSHSISAPSALPCLVVPYCDRSRRTPLEWAQQLVHPQGHDKVQDTDASMHPPQ